jgi:hypothetical protein
VETGRSLPTFHHHQFNEWWWWRQQATLKRRWTFTRLHNATSKKIVILPSIYFLPLKWEVKFHIHTKWFVFRTRRVSTALNQPSTAASKSWGSSVSIWPDYGPDDRDSIPEKYFSLALGSYPTLGPNGFLSIGVRVLQCFQAIYPVRRMKRISCPTRLMYVRDIKSHCNRFNKSFSEHYCE